MAGRKKEALVQFHKKSILDTAEKLFSEKGIRQTTMDDIAKAADYSKSTLYVYFKSKDEIYEHIIYSHMCRLKESMEECTRENLDFEQCYFRICAKLSQLYEQYPLYFPAFSGISPWMSSLLPTARSCTLFMMWVKKSMTALQRFSGRESGKAYSPPTSISCPPPLPSGPHWEA